MMIRLIACTLLLGACGGGGGPSDPGTSGTGTPAPVATVVVSPATATVVVGGTQQMTVVTKDAAGNTLSGRTVTWTTSDAAKATVSSAGLVTAVAAGSATITATSEGKTATASVTLTPGSTTGTPSSITIISGGSQSGAPNSTIAEPLVVEVRDANGAALSGVSVQFVTGGEGQFVGGATVPSNGGYITNMLNVITGSNGRASAQFRLGTTGTYSAAARLIGGTPQILAGTRFTAIGTHAAFVATVSVGPGPQGVAVDATTNRVYVGNNGTFFGCSDYATGTGVQSSTISVIDGATNTVTTAQAGGTGPIYAVPNAATQKLYVAAEGLTVLSVTTLQQLARINEAATHQPAINAVRNEIWTNAKHGPNATPALSHVDGATDRLLGFVDLPGQTHGVALSAARNEVYATYVDRGGVFVVDGATRTLATTISTPHALGIAYNATTDRLYLSSGNFGAVYVVNPAARTLVSTITVNAHTMELAVDVGRNRVYAASMSNPYSVLVIDGATNALLGRVPVGTCPFGVAYNPTNNRIYVSNGHDNSVTVLDATKVP